MAFSCRSCSSSPKMLIQKNMSTFEADEHLRGCKAGPGIYWYAESAAKVLG